MGRAAVESRDANRSTEVAGAVQASRFPIGLRELIAQELDSRIDGQDARAPATRGRDVGQRWQIESEGLARPGSGADDRPAASACVEARENLARRIDLEAG